MMTRRVWRSFRQGPHGNNFGFDFGIDDISFAPFISTANAGRDTVVCGGSIPLGTAYCNLPAVSFSWSPHTGLNSYTIPNPTLNSTVLVPNVPYTYTLTMTLGGIVTTDQVTVMRVWLWGLKSMRIHNLFVRQDRLPLCPAVYHFGRITLPYTYQWAAIAGGAPIGALSSTTAASPVFTYGVPGVYKYWVTVHAPLPDLREITYVRIIKSKR